jgi:two-component system sensor histidine kinase BaeS
MGWDTALRRKKRPASRRWLGWPLRSLAVKLTLAFLLVGLIGAILVALLVGQRTRSEFDRFRSERDQAALVEALGSYYAANGSWDGVGDMLNRQPQQNFFGRHIALADARGSVVLGNADYSPGQRLPDSVLSAGAPISASGQTIGYLIPDAPGDRPNAPPPPDVAFLNRVAWAAALSAGVASAIALLLGALLARTLTRPVRELTAATKAMAGGKLDQRVAVRSRDEIGELATSFNQMSADLARASQLRKQMTADLAHDLRTPLSILRGYTEGLQDGRLKGSPAMYTVMHGEVEHLQRLVEDLRVLSLADAGELPLHRRAVDPAALLERTGLAYMVQAEQQGVALRVEAGAGLPSIAVDTDRMTQVLNNLVSNALRYTKEGGAIVLSATQETEDQRPKTKDQPLAPLLLAPSSLVVLRVSDTGSGIALEDLPFVFDRFYRADKARQRTDANASGLGLAIAKAIVEAHDGTIAVESSRDTGTAFTIRLPAAQRREDAGAPPSSPNARAPGAREPISEVL